MEKLSFKALSDQDFELVLHWFNEPHVQKFYSLRPWTLEQVERKLTPYLSPNAQVNAFIFYIGKTPVGYCQYYPLAPFPWPGQDFSQEVVEQGGGIDFFIGDPTYIGKGISSQMLKKFLQKLVAPHYSWFVADPNTENQRSIDMLAHLGFWPHQVITTKNALGDPEQLQLMIRSANDL